MTKHTEATFHLNQEIDCQDAADVLGAITHLLDLATYRPAEPGSNFHGQLELSYRQVHGLSVIIDSVAGGLETSHQESERRPETITTVTETGIDKDRDRRIIQQQLTNEYSSADDDQGSYPKVDLTARELAIKETFNKGFPVEEIAKAVNLKKGTVQQMIDKLKANGTITSEPQPDNLPHAVNS